MTKKITNRVLLKSGRKQLNPEEKDISRNKRQQWGKEWRSEYSKNKREKKLLWAARKRAKERNLEINIEESDIVIPTHCPYLKIPLVASRPRGSSRRDVASLDRIDPTKGYIKGNIEVISHLANTMKNDATPELLLNFANEIISRYNSVLRLRDDDTQQGSSV